MSQRICENGFIHRDTETILQYVIQCQACGAKQIVFQDEDHSLIEADHRKECKVRNRDDRRTYG